MAETLSLPILLAFSCSSCDLGAHSRPDIHRNARAQISNTFHGGTGSSMRECHRSTSLINMPIFARRYKWNSPYHRYPAVEDFLGCRLLTGSPRSSTIKHGWSTLGQSLKQGPFPMLRYYHSAETQPPRKDAFSKYTQRTTEGCGGL
jgi:hypothetical protein